MINSAILSGVDLRKSYGALEVLKGVSLAVERGEFACLVGKSGCGKTTLLSLLSGLEKPTEGKGNPWREEKSPVPPRTNSLFSGVKMSGSFSSPST